MSVRLGLKVFLALVWADGAAASPLVCTFTEKQQCAPGNGCTPVKPAVFVKTDLKARTYERCDRNGCDSYEATISTSGDFTTLEVLGRGVFAKLGPDRRMTEVVSLGNAVLVSFGACAAP